MTEINKEIPQVLINGVVESDIFLKNQDNIKKARDAFNDTSLDAESLFKIVPEEICDCIYFVLNAEKHKINLMESSDESFHSIYDYVRDVSFNHLDNIILHPGYMKHFFDSSLNEEYFMKENIPDGVSCNPIWTDFQNVFTIPLIDVRIDNNNEEVLFKSTMGWDDLSFVIRALSQGIRKNYFSSQEMINKDTFHIPNIDTTAYNITQARDALQSIIDNMNSSTDRPASEPDKDS